MKKLRIHRGRHYRRRQPKFSAHQLLCRLLDRIALRVGRHNRVLLRLRAKVQGPHIL